MKAAEFEAFLKDAGYAYHVEQGDNAKRVYFRDRGCAFCGIANDSEPQFLYLVARFRLAATLPDAARLQQVMRDLEDEYPVVKLRSPAAKKEPFFEVTTEQFEADMDAVGAIFWHTLDLMRIVSEECYRRLEPKPEKSLPTDDVGEFVAHIEDELRRGCGNGEASAITTATDTIRLSLALSIDNEGSTGSAFCVASGKDASVYVTNAHVVGEHGQLTLYRQRPTYEKMTGTVITRGDPKELDLAIISVPVPEIPAVVISAKPPRPDIPVAVAGYARVQIYAAETLHGLFSATHVGTITAVSDDGGNILHDALSRPGDSGGPLFDPATGEVFGVQRGGWDAEGEGIAIGQKPLLSFLVENDVKFNCHASVLKSDTCTEKPMEKIVKSSASAGQ